MSFRRKRRRDLPIEDPLEDLKALILLGLSMIPDVGAILSTLASLLWPFSAQDVWEEIRERIEALVNRKIDEAVFSLLHSRLNGIGHSLKLFLRVKQSGDGELIRMQFVACNTLCVEAASEFRNKDFEWLLAPLFAMFACIHMALLRDCVLHGREWGMNENVYRVFLEQARQVLAGYSAYLCHVIAREEARLTKDEPSGGGPHMTDYYQYWQPYKQQRTVLLDDFQRILAHLDAEAYPARADNIEFGDVYSPAYGTADDWDDVCAGWAKWVTTPFGQPLADMRSIYLEYFNFTPRIVTMSYYPGNGPKVWGAERTDSCGIIAEEVRGVETACFELPSPGAARGFSLKKAWVRCGSIPLSLILVPFSGNSLTLWDRRSPSGGDWYAVEVPGRALTTLTLWARSYYYDSDAGCVIFGFSRDPRHVPERARVAWYVGTPPGSEAPPGGLGVGEAAARQEREAFWRAIMQMRG
ncbi:insecticidal delta-endotoxin Cry8Ea1 family protein [Paludibacterium paludis]|uniref:insecticidal delta-endotoxin Cry8Ea1 family protein n=1 Tax=Paludibacterium paludis TaxID=1225769 RepID=UPI001673896B|nr:insecticidal delta-endotoxin Cry8Ea1 family protein [Paludibacterium paludis]